MWSFGLGVEPDKANANRRVTGVREGQSGNSFSAKLHEQYGRKHVADYTVLSSAIRSEACFAERPKYSIAIATSSRRTSSVGGGVRKKAT